LNAVNKLPTTHSKQAKKQEKQERQEKTKSSPSLPVVVRRQVKVIPGRYCLVDGHASANNEHYRY